MILKSKNKKIILTLSLLLATTLATFSLIRWLAPKPSPVNIEAIKVTGAVQETDEARLLARKELLSLLLRGKIITPSFTVEPLPDNSKIVVTISGDLTKGKQDFQNWLRDNNYTHIDPTQFSYVRQ